jgi:hypothetical protein
MNITKEMLEAVCLRGENLEKKSRVDTILNTCLRSAINGFDFTSFNYDENNEEETKSMNEIAEELKALNFSVHFDGDESNMHMFVSWH